MKRTDALVIGGGLAGSAAAYFLSRQNLSVTIIENPNPHPNPGSLVPIGVLKPHFSVDCGLSDQFYTAGFYLTLELCKALLEAQDFQICSLLRFLDESKVSARYTALLRRSDLKKIIQLYSPGECASALKFKSEAPALLFHETAWIKPQALCNVLKQSSSLIHQRLAHASTVTYHDQLWHTYSKEGQELACAPLCLFACGSEFKSFPVLRHLPFRLVGGQMSLIKASPETERLSYILNDQSTLTPAIEGLHALSGSFRTSNPHFNIDPAEHTALLKGLLKTTPDLLECFLNQPYQAWVGVRVSTPDYLPCVGALPDYLTFMKDFQGITQGKTKRHLPSVQYLPGCYVSMGHGSRGLGSTLLAGKILAAMMTHQSVPISNQIVQVLKPERFWVRQLKKNS